MSIWNSSSLTFSEHPPRHKSGLVHNTPTRISKQHMVEHKMFGKKRKNIQLGMTFKKKGKGVGIKKPKSAVMEPKMKGLSPSIEEFDRMMENIHNGSSMNSNRKPFSRKFFG